LKNSFKKHKSRLLCLLPEQGGFTMIEILLAVMMLSLLFSSGYGIMRYTRSETEKGFWIQQAITQLRNGTRMISDKLKQTSYPSTIIKKSGEEKVVYYKEKREYDFTGRLIDMPTHENDNFDMHAMVTDSGSIIPDSSEHTILYFPICTPEKELESGYEEGTITWIELVLAPSPEYQHTGLGELHLRERIDTYNTKSDPDRAYDLDKEFSDSLTIRRDRVIIEDVSEIDIEYFEIEELRGVFYVEGVKKEKLTKRILATISIGCSHPKDPKTWLSDQCSVVTNVGIVREPVSNVLALLEIFSTSARIKYNTDERTVSEGDSIGDFEVSEINSDNVLLVHKDTGNERILTIKN
jgi:prepilin-type N-terminal cleavage/methylation domain-containing protein